MTPFLKLVADDLFQKLGGDFQDTTIIFPNKRASLFFDQYLWQNARGKTMWTPEYTTISELFASLSDLVLADPVFLVVKLFEVYKRQMNPTKSLDQLYSLMETMLSDFQDIDNNMVEPSQLFLNIADLKEMTDFSFLEEEQRMAIGQFFGRFFDHVDTNTPLKTQFKTLWNHMTSIYKDFHTTLLHPEDGEGPMVYEGMLKRMVVETLKGGDETARKRIETRLTSKTYVMVGFNVLNKTEQELFRHIKQHRDAKFYWDYDVAYTKKAASNLLGKYEAGQFINENIALLGDELKGRDLFSNMRKPKSIKFIQSPTENAQTRHIAEWMRTHIKEDEPLQQSAVILCNENLLEPVLHSIKPIPALNVTMGYPLTNTPTFSLVQVLLDLQVHGRTRFGSWRYKYVSAVLKHAFVQKLVGEESGETLRHLTKHNVIFPSAEFFAGNETLRHIFTPVSGAQLTAYLADIMSMVGHSYQDAADSKNFSQQIYKESIFVAYTTLNRIKSLQEGHTALQVGDETLSHIILQLLRQATIPFHGEPAIGLQVMGLLETRNLDFRNVIMLSVNEGQIPKGDKRTSLIPYTLRAAYGMTTIEKEVSLYAYYYYRLLQRAENITLLYNANTEGGSKGEMSRFMLQTLAEQKDLFAEGQEIALQAFTSPSETQAMEPFCVQKDPEVMEQLHKRFNKERILSPSALNTYMKCPLKFYFNYVMGLRPDDDVSEDVDNSMFGTIFHYAMQKLYEPHVGKPLPCTILSKMAEDTKLITQHINNAFAVKLFLLPENDEAGHAINYSEGRRMTLNGTQLINRHVIRKFVANQIKADALMARELEGAGGYLQIISQEQQYTTLLNNTLLLGGYIDRLDLLASPQGNRIRIVDYKTSNSPHSANNVTDLFDTGKCAKNYHIMQTLYYAKVLTTKGAQYANDAVCPALMYPAKDFGNNFSGIVKLVPPDGIKKKEIADFKAQHGEEFDTLLEGIIEGIFTPYDADNDLGTFVQCADEQNCAYCDFITFCRRHPKKNH